jgi:hypothetical protein
LITRTHNGYHLGDNLVHLNFLRKVALAHPDRQFVHAAQWQYEKQLKDVISDVPNIKLEHFGYMTPALSIDSWRGAGGFWYNHEHRNDFVKFHTDFWFPYLASQMGVDNPIQSAKDMLFDYPTILHGLNGKFPNGCDVLVINSPPGSGQFSGYNGYALAELASAISANGFKVVATAELPSHIVNVETTVKAGLTATQIGSLSIHCHSILMVSTGPSWSTFNIWNQDTVLNRIILLDSERVWLSPNTIHCSNIAEAGNVLKESGLI